MQSKAATVAEYLASLPADRRAALEAVRKVFRDNLDPAYSEGMSYGMIGYCIPHSVYPAGYHCDPRQPLPYAGMASQKNHMSLYLMCVYGNDGDNDLYRWFTDAWKKTGKKLDMGKACVRFKKVEDLALDVIAELLRKTPAKAYIAHYEAAIQNNAANAAKRKAARAKAKAPVKKKLAAKPTKGRKSAR